MRIAIDAMGGDHAPAEIVAGALMAAELYPDTEFILVGDETAIRAELGAGQPDNITLHHAAETIAMDDDPARTVRRKPDSSLVVACRMAAGEADAMFSAGNTGAVAAAATLLLGRLPGVQRPCIAAVLPTGVGKAVVCDVGACVDCRPEWVVQFGVMGSIYAEDVERIRDPKVGLLSIGEEACKGNALTKSANQLFQTAGVRFVGNVEGKDLFRGAADVIACDGFDGNLLLKIAEGAADMFVRMTKEAMMQTIWTRLGALLVRPGLMQLKRTIDYAEYGGAFLLGIKGLVVIGHGRSDRRAVCSALRRAREGAERRLVSRLEARFSADEAAA